MAVPGSDKNGAGRVSAVTPNLLPSSRFLPLPDEPLVTVVTPSLNQGRFIEHTIRSVLEQDYPAIEYLVFDGGSSDETLAVLRRYKGRLHWISERDGGQAEAINRGWRQARGHILAWLNADDCYAPGAVRAAVALLRQNPQLAVVYGDCDYIDAAGKRIGQHRTAGWDFTKMARTLGAPIAQPASFYRQEALAAVDFLDPTLMMALDIDLWLRLGLHYEFRYLPQTLAAFRIHDESKTTTRGTRFAHEFRLIYRRLFKHPALPQAIYALRNEIEASIALAAANYAFLAGDLTEARRQVYLGWSHAPRRLRTTAVKILVIGALGSRFWSTYQSMRTQLVRLLPGLNP